MIVASTWKVVEMSNFFTHLHYLKITREYLISLEDRGNEYLNRNIKLGTNEKEWEKLF